ncbi:MAG: arginine--tRNA ligase [Lachnospiraceae bacterium]|nr:arginine--tRNA ligase [Lachnospiraceae bacterium]
MKKILDALSEVVGQAFVDSGYDASLGKVTLSNRPDLCEFQCNGSMAGAKMYRKAPIMIANAVVEKLQEQNAENPVWQEVTAVMPGFINLKLHPDFLAGMLTEMNEDAKLGCLCEAEPKTMVIDYGGPNVAKPLHIGHLRSAIIGESIKRICRYMGNQVIGDVHLGDWGLQMGLIMQELKERQPELPYFDPVFEGEYPAEAPFTIGELEEIYPAASAKSKVDEEFSRKAHDTTFLFQQGDRGLVALWKHIIRVSVNDLKENYRKLNVDFDVWYGESDAQPFIPAMVEKMKADGFARESQGALIVDVAEETDTKEVPPCILVKSDGATLYSTTDLATIVQRVQEYDPDAMIYLTDKRQEMHFTQVFRCSRKTGLVGDDVSLTHIGFGTMNGKDGKPFKTRSGGVMRLEYLISEIQEAVYNRIMENENRSMDEEEAKAASAVIGLAALKYGDLSNQASKDYIFDIERFASFEGNTGPYILYTIVRIKSILAKCAQTMDNDMAVDVATDVAATINPAFNDSEKQLQLCLAQFNEMMDVAYRELAPHKICQYIYDLSNAFNQFYHNNKILTEPDEEKRAGYIRLITLTKKVLETGIDLLGFEAPDRM